MVEGRKDEDERGLEQLRSLVINERLQSKRSVIGFITKRQPMLSGGSRNITVWSLLRFLRSGQLRGYNSD